MAINTSTITQLSSDFRALSQKDSVSPESLGVLLQQLADLISSAAADGKFTQITLAQSFNTYGIFVDYGTGSNTPRGNSGDLGDGFVNRRKRRRWFSRKYFASVMNIQEFYADNLGRQFCNAISNALNPDVMRRDVTK